MEEFQDSEINTASNTLSDAQTLVASGNSTAQNLDCRQLEVLIAQNQVKQVKLLKEMKNLNENCIKVLKFIGWFIWLFESEDSELTSVKEEVTPLATKYNICLEHEDYYWPDYPEQWLIFPLDECDDVEDYNKCKTIVNYQKKIEEYLVEWDRLEEEDEVDLDIEEDQKGLNDERIRKFEVVIVTSLTSFECCPVCLGIPKKDERMMKLDCNHILHETCATNWLKIKSSCPVCRQDLTKLDKFGELGALVSQMNLDEDEVLELKRQVEEITSEALP